MNLEDLNRGPHSPMVQQWLLLSRSSQLWFELHFGEIAIIPAHRPHPLFLSAQPKYVSSSIRRSEISWPGESESAAGWEDGQGQQKGKPYLQASFGVPKARSRRERASDRRPESHTTFG